MCASEFCVIDFVCFGMWAEKIDGGYHFKACNSSAFDKSISDTNPISSRYTFLVSFFFLLCVCVRVSVQMKSTVGFLCGGVFVELKWRWGGPSIWKQREIDSQDWTMFIYNGAEENRFVPDDIFIDCNMYCPSSHWKWLISGLAVVVLFLGGQGAMFTQRVGLLCFIPS